MADEERKAHAMTKGEKMARLLCLLIALVGVVITAVPIVFTLEPYAVPLILVGCGVAVIALGTFMYFSI